MNYLQISTIKPVNCKTQTKHRTFGLARTLSEFINDNRFTLGIDNAILH